MSRIGILSSHGLCRLICLYLLCANVGCMATRGWAANKSGMRAYKRCHYVQARNRFARAVCFNPCNPDYRHNLAMALQKQGDPMACEKILRHNLTIDAMHQPTYHSLSQMMVNQGRVAEAQDLLAGWVATQPYIPEPNIEMAWLQKETGDIPGAEASLQQALKTAPTNPVALSQLGQLYQSTGRNEMAATYYQRSLAANWDQPEVQSRLATLSDPQFRSQSRSAMMQNSPSSPMMADMSPIATENLIAGGPASSNDPMMVSYSTSMADGTVTGAPNLVSDPSYQNGMAVNEPPMMTMSPPKNIEIPFGSDNEAIALEELNANPPPKRQNHRKKGKHNDPVMTTYPLPNFDAPATAWTPSGTLPGQPGTAYQSPTAFQSPIIASDVTPIPIVGGPQMGGGRFSPTPINGGNAGLAPQADPAHFYGAGQEITASLPVVDPH